MGVYTMQSYTVITAQDALLKGFVKICSATIPLSFLLNKINQLLTFVRCMGIEY